VCVSLRVFVVVCQNYFVYVCGVVCEIGSWPRRKQEIRSDK